MSENILKNVKIFNCFKEINFHGQQRHPLQLIYVTFLLKIYLCQSNILLTFHYMIFKSELDLYIK